MLSTANLRRRLGVLVAVTAMLATACGSDATDASNRARSVVDGATLGDQTDLVETGACTIETIIDEYGFEIEITTCEETEAPVTTLSPEIPPQTLPLTVVEAVGILAPTPQTQAAARRLTESLDAAHTLCGDLGAWAAAVSALSSTITSLVELLGDVDDPSWVGSTDAEQLVAEVRQRLFEQGDCIPGTEPPTTTESPPTTQAPETTEAEALVGFDALSRGIAAAARATGEYERLRIAALGLDSVGTSSEFWSHSDQLGHINAVSSAATVSAPFDLAIVGGDAARRGIDPDALADALDRRVLNASITALRPATRDVWLTDLTAVGLSPSTLVLADSSHVFFQACDEEALNLFRDAARRRANVFPNVPGLEDIAGSLRLAGGFTRGNRGPISERYAETFGDSLTGRSGDISVPNDAWREAQLGRYEAVYAAPTLCEASFDALESQATDAIAAGLDVFIVSMPLSEQVAELHPDGRAGHAPVIERQSQIATDTGATFVDLSELLRTDWFFDLHNPTEDGRRVLTSALGDALK